MSERRTYSQTLIFSSTLVTGAAALASGADRGAVIYDNGAPDGVNAYSNMTREVQGARRTLLDDFVIDVPWVMSGLRHHAIWSTLDPGAGVSMEVSFRLDDENTPGMRLRVADVTSYEEQATGNVFFSRAEYVAFTTFDDIILGPGRYWLEATVVGPENNFWLTAPQQNEECWAFYEDVDGLVPGSAMFGSPADLAWSVVGSFCVGAVGCCFDDEPCLDVAECSECLALGGAPLGVGILCGEAECPSPCIGDIDGSRTIDFSDFLLLLAAWGPCPPGICPGDLDGDKQVGFDDVLILLAGWGDCG